jgi:hypothetical protein
MRLAKRIEGADSHMLRAREEGISLQNKRMSEAFELAYDTKHDRYDRTAWAKYIQLCEDRTIRLLPV